MDSGELTHMTYVEKTNSDDNQEKLNMHEGRKTNPNNGEKAPLHSLLDLVPRLGTSNNRQRSEKDFPKKKKKKKAESA